MQQAKYCSCCSTLLKCRAEIAQDAVYHCTQHFAQIAYVVQTHYAAALEKLKAEVSNIANQYKHYSSGVIRLEVRASGNSLC